jgi:hypothetical protein
MRRHMVTGLVCCVLLAGCVAAPMEPPSTVGSKAPATAVSDQAATFVDWQRGPGMPFDRTKILVRLDDGQQVYVDCPFRLEIEDKERARLMVRQNQDGGWVATSVTSQ